MKHPVLVLLGLLAVAAAPVSHAVEILRWERMPLAVPLKDSAGQVLAALNVGTHAGRVSRQELETRFLPVLLEASRELSTRLFH